MTGKRTQCKGCKAFSMLPTWLTTTDRGGSDEKMLIVVQRGTLGAQLWQPRGAAAGI
jgi:hypothetical protein